MAEPAIRLEGVTKSFPGSRQPAVADLSFDVPAGEIVMLVGPSGCGKTTTLKMINRLIEPSSGRIVVNGRDVHSLPPHELRRSIGYVIQQIGLFPHRTVADNIATVPHLLGWDRARTHRRTDELIELIGLSRDLLGRYPSALSGGQQQRVGVARALAADPPVLLMDEPFGAVDPIVRSRLQDLLLDLQHQLHKSIVLVTHDIDEAIKLGSRVALLNVGGVLEQYAPPDELLAEPANDFVRQFLGRERGLKRLSLVPVHRVKLDRGPVVTPEATAAEARTVAEEAGLDWVAVAGDTELYGWLWTRDLEEGRPLGDHELQDFRVRITPDNSLREALDAIVTSRTRVAVVFDDLQYLGMLTLEQISEEVVL